MMTHSRIFVHQLILL